MSKKIFISHSQNDKPLVDSFVDLLQTGANISSTDIFCSSLEGMGIPAGENFIKFIKDQLEEPEAVIVFMSKNYFFSQFCLCELGASWMLSKFILPLLVEPLTFTDIEGVLTGTQATRLNDNNDLNIFVDSLNERINNKKFNFSRWEIKRDKFQEGSNTIIGVLPKPEIVTSKEFQTLKVHYESAKSEIEQLMDELEKVKRLNEEIKKLKDKDEVRNVVLENITERERFDNILSETKEVLGRNPSVVNYALFKYSKDEEIFIRSYFEQKNLADEANHAVDEDYLIKNENSYSLNTQDPTVSKSLFAIEELKEVLGSLSKELYDLLEENYNLRPIIENQKFWEEVLELRINYW